MSVWTDWIQWDGLHFLRPYWLWAFLPLLFMIWALYRQKPKQTAWETICDPHLLSAQLVTAGKDQSRGPIWILALCWLLACIALSGPTWTRQVISVYQPLNSRILALDLSAAMQTPDLQPSRWQRAIYKTMDLLTQWQTGQTGMVVFTNEAYLVSPLTEDTHTISNLASSLKPTLMPVGGQNIQAALLKAASLLEQTAVRDGKIIVMTCGPASKADMQTAQDLHQRGINIYVIAVGTAQGAPTALPTGDFARSRKGELLMNPVALKSLKQLAAAGGGSLIEFSTDGSDIKKLNQQIDVDWQTKAKQMKDQTIVIWKDQGRWFAVLLLPLVMYLLCL